MKNRAWLVYLVAAVVASIVYFAVGQNSFLFNLIGLSSPILILVAIHIHKPERRAPWLLIAFGQFVFIAGDVVSYNYARFAAAIPTVFPLDFTFNPKATFPFPGPADALYLLVYPFLTAGIFLLIRARNPGRDRAGLIDSLLVAIGLGTVSWVFLIAPYTELTDLEMKVKLTAMAYPVADLLLAGFGDPPRRRCRPQAAGLLPDDGGDRRPLRDGRDLRLVRPVHGGGLPAGERPARGRMARLLRVAGDGGTASRRCTSSPIEPPHPMSG